MKLDAEIGLLLCDAINRYMNTELRADSRRFDDGTFIAEDVLDVFDQKLHEVMTTAISAKITEMESAGKIVKVDTTDFGGYEFDGLYQFVDAFLARGSESGTTESDGSA